MVLEDPGQPAGDIGRRRTTRVEDAPQLGTSSVYADSPQTCQNSVVDYGRNTPEAK